MSPGWVQLIVDYPNLAAGAPDALKQAVEIAYYQRGVCLARRPEGLFDVQVQSEARALEPAATALRHGLRLRHTLQTEHAAVEALGAVHGLGTGGHGELDMVDAQE